MKTLVAACLLFLFATERVHYSDGVFLSTHPNPPLAIPGALVTITCTISNSSILEWFSTEYIGAEVLQILSHTGAQSSVTSISNPSTIARRLNFTDGVIISELRLTASAQYPLSSVTCRNNALRSNVTITLHTLESYITLASEGEVVSSGEIKEFNCTTIGSSIMAWYSEEYIGVNDLQILSHNRAATVVSSVNNPSTIATRLSSTVENGLPVIVSQLRIVVSSQYQTASVTCRNIATGISRTIEIQISDTGRTTTLPATQNYATSSDHDTEPITSGSAVSENRVIGVTTAVASCILVAIVVAIAIVITGVVVLKNSGKVSTDDTKISHSEKHTFDQESLKECVNADAPRSPDSSLSKSSRDSAHSADVLIDDAKITTTA